MGHRLAACAVVLSAASVARAQDASTGAIQGVVRTSEGVRVSEVVVRVSDRSGVVAQTRADFDGRFFVSGLPPGTYRLGFWRANTELVYGEVVVRADAVTVLPVRGPGRFVARSIDPASMALRTVVGRDLLDHGVRVGFDVDAMFGIAPGAQGDGFGVGFGGSDSLENRYLVDDVDVGGVVYPTLGASVPLELVDDLAIITDGSGAATGGFTGGLVRVRTRRGGNEIHGSVFATVAPGALVAERERAPAGGSSIETRADLDFSILAGGELGGPIVRDHAWYWLGVVPRWTSSTMTRTTRRRSDCRTMLGSGELSIAADQPCHSRPRGEWEQDGVADVDPATGFEIYEDIDRAEYDLGSRGMTLAAKIDGAVDPAHQGGLSVMVTPTFENTARWYGIVDEQRLETRAVTSDIAARWTSRLTKTTLSAVVGLHRSSYRLRSANGRDDVPLQELSFGDLGEWSKLGGESAATRAGCEDETAGDPYPGMTNCPVATTYSIGGPGELTDDAEQRISLQTAISRRSDFIGRHVFQLGVGIEDARAWKSRLYSGGRMLSTGGELVRQSRWVEIRDAGTPGTAPCQDGEAFFGCDPITAGDAAARAGHGAFGWSLFFEEVWTPLPQLSFEFGVRRDKQSLRDAFAVPATWSPHVGLAYDPTKEGRSRFYLHWGNYTERLPLNVTQRRLGGGTLEYRTYGDRTPNPCGEPVEGFGGVDGTACDPDDPSVVGSVAVPEPWPVAPDLLGQVVSEDVYGYDREVRPGVTFGVAYVHRQISSVIEDVTDGPGSLLIANPGVGLAEHVEAAARDHRAYHFKLRARVSHALAIDASYVLAGTDGNYPGLVSPDNGQVEPNLSSQYDLIETLPNRTGPLPQDRTHVAKVDGYYTFGAVTLGGRARALSGTPIDVLGRHYRYGPSEVFLLPRGAMGRTDFTYSLDLHADYERDLGHGLRLRLFVDVLNVANRQGTFEVDEEYTRRSNAHPIVGGEYADLIWAKERGTTGAESSVPVQRNPHFGQTESRYAPLSARFGVRLTF